MTAQPAGTSAPAPATPPVDRPEDGSLEALAVEAVLGANPFVGLSTQQVVAAAGRLLLRLGLRPRVVLKHTASLAKDLALVVVGRSDIAPAKGDKRWADPAWQENPAYRRLQQVYLAVVQEIDKAIGDAGLDIKSDMRVRFAVGILIKALSPTYTLLN